MGVQALCGVNRAGSIQEHHGVGYGRIRDAAYLPRRASAQVQGRVLQSEVGVDEIWAPSGQHLRVDVLRASTVLV